jgi:fluoride exporter
MPLVLYVALGSALGGAGRYAIGGAVDARWQQACWGLSVGTLLVNVLGSFLIAALIPWCKHEAVRAFVAFGLMGGFTTFSSFSLQTVAFLEKGLLLPALLNGGLNLFCCLVAAGLGLWLARAVS